jgi:osmotically-inducible protein OsmY
MEIAVMKYLNTICAIFSAIALATILGCASTPTREGAGEYVDDTVITTKVKAAVFAEPTLKSAEINVETFKGVVQLSGFVSSEADTQKAVEVARKVKGVESVKNDMRIKGRP